MGFVGNVKSRIDAYMEGSEIVEYRVIVGVVFLLMFGLIMNYSATGSILKPTVFAAAGFVGMLVVSYIDYHIYLDFALPIYAIALVIIFPARFGRFAHDVNGAYRWIRVGGFSFQPSELMKPAIIILLTAMIVLMKRYMATIKGILLIGLVTGAPVIVIWRITKDLSTAAIILCIAICMFYVAYPNKKVYLLYGAGGIAAVGLALRYIMITLPQKTEEMLSFRDYRVLSWLYPDLYPDYAYQTVTSVRAISFGGLLGRGLGNGIVNTPYQENDFVFALIAEELGLVGCLIVLFLFFYLVRIIFKISRYAGDIQGQYVSMGIAIHIAMQVILHVAVVTGTVPNTGISLPFISQGGTAWLIQLAEMGIVLNISRTIKGKRLRSGESAGRQERRDNRQLRKTA